MKTLFSWNVNGFRSVAAKGALDGFLAAARPDMLCLQETKLSPGMVARPDAPFRANAYPGSGALAEMFPHQFWHIARKPGYSGTALLSKEAPLAVAYDFEGADSPTEGRVITAEFPRAFVVNAYVPNSQDGLARLDYRLGWDAAFRAHLCALAEKKPVFACGDFNCAHTEIDLANPGANRRSAGFTDEERGSLSALLSAGFADTFRAANPGAERRYTWWSYRARARERNVGWRIDYWLATRGAVWTAPQIHDSFPGSDHCPVSVSAEV